MHYFSTVKKLRNPTVIVLAFARKSQKVWKNIRKDSKSLVKFNRKFDFLLFLEIFLLKIEPWEITSFFSNIFSVSVGFPPFPSGYALDTVLPIFDKN